MQRLGLWADHAPAGTMKSGTGSRPRRITWETTLVKQELGLGKTRAGAEGRPGKTIAFINVFVDWLWRQARLDSVEAPMGMHESEDMVWVMPVWARLQYPPDRAETVKNHARIG